MASDRTNHPDADPSLSETVTGWIEALGRGDRGAAESVWSEVYAQLRRMAARRLGALPPGDTLQPTALVHEVYARLECDGGTSWANRHHLVFAAARAKATLKRGGGLQRLDLDLVQAPHSALRMNCSRSQRRLPRSSARMRAAIRSSCSGSLRVSMSRRPRKCWACRGAPSSASGGSPGSRCTRRSSPGRTKRPP